MWDLREGVVGAETFIPKHVVIITWKNMSFAGGIDISLYKACVIYINTSEESHNFHIYNIIL